MVKSKGPVKHGAGCPSTDPGEAARPSHLEFAQDWPNLLTRLDAVCRSNYKAGPEN